jgi:hypothetical protein
VLQEKSPQRQALRAQIDLQLGGGRQAEEVPEKIGVVLRADERVAGEVQADEGAHRALAVVEAHEPAPLVRFSRVQRHGAEQRDGELSSVRELDRNRLRGRGAAQALDAQEIEQRIGDADQLRLDDEMAPGLDPRHDLAQAARVERLAAVRQQQHAPRLEGVEIGQRAQLARGEAHARGEAARGEIRVAARLGRWADPLARGHSLVGRQEPHHARGEKREQPEWKQPAPHAKASL